MKVPAVVIDIPWPSGWLNPHAKGHWRPKAEATAKARRDAAIIARAAKVGEWPQAVLQFAYFPPPRNRRDAHNMPGYLKAAIDGIADAMGCDDRDFRCRFPDHFGAKSKLGYVRVCIANEAAKHDV